MNADRKSQNEYWFVSISEGKNWLGVKTALDLLGVAEDVFNPSTWRGRGIADGGVDWGLWGHRGRQRGQPGLQSKFEISQGYTKTPYLKKPKAN